MTKDFISVVFSKMYLFCETNFKLFFERNKNFYMA